MSFICYKYIPTVPKSILWGTTKAVRLRKMTYVSKRYELAGKLRFISSMIDSFEIGVIHLISSEKAYNRHSRHADLGVRIQSGNGYSDPTGNQAVENVMIKDAMKACDFSGDLLKDTDASEEHRRDILTIKMMREESPSMSTRIAL